jgi:hypothetical protein
MFCRNRIGFIRRAVESILNQSYPHWELVVQDGASTDGTWEAIAAYGDPRIKLVSEPDTGPFDAMWRAFGRCRGEVIGSCLSDEEFLPSTLANGIQYFRCHPEAAAVFGDLNYTDAQGVVIGRQNCTEFNFLDYLGFDSTLTLQATLFRRQALEDIGLFSRQWKTNCADFELMIHLGERHRLDYHPGLVGRYAQSHEGQLSTTPAVGFFCSVGQLQLIDEFFRQNSTRDQLRDIPLHQAYDRIRKLYVDRGATDLRDQLDKLYANFEVKPLQDSLAKALQAARIGKITLALEILTRLEMTPENWYMIARAQAEILERLCLPWEAAESWEWQAEQGVPQAAERALIGRLNVPEVNPLQILAGQKKWAHRQLKIPSLPSFAPARSPRPGKIHLAWHATDWNNLTLRTQILPVLPHFDSALFILSCYAPHESDPELFPPGVTVRPVPRSWSDQEFAERVRQDQVDVLVELSGLSVGHRWAAIAGRCAPVQIAYLGHMATSGLRPVDYQLVDQILCPPGTEKYFTEKLLHLPGSYTCFQFPTIHLPPGAPPPRRLDERLTLGCFAPSARINRWHLQHWGEILRSIPGSRLLLANPEFASSDSRTTIRACLRGASD